MSSEKIDIVIKTDDLKQSFLKHLNLENNKRILFSGPFGIGKSTFLNEIENEYQENYFFVKLNPVNYSVSSNEDVFELIKFDILLQLVGKYNKECNLKEEDFTVMLKSQMFIMEHLKMMPLLSSILGLSEKIGTPVIEFLKTLNETVENYKKFSNNIKIDENADIESFLNSVQNKKGSLHEMNAISELIKDLVCRIKSNRENATSNATSVLIIDDIDRLDPEHIFRLFNIFSAHYDSFDGANKFGFEKVIFVCDIINIKNLFHHKYGKNVDFSGYIDKFYSLYPYNFDNIENIVAELDRIIVRNTFSNEFNYKSYYSYDNKGFNLVLKSIFKALILNKEINLRDLLSEKNINIPNFDYRYNPKPYNLPYNSVTTPFLVLMYVIKCFFSDIESMEQAFEKLNNKSKAELFNQVNKIKSLPNQTEIINNLMCFCLPFLIYDNNPITYNQINFIVFLEKEKIYIHFKKFDFNEFNLLNFEKATLKESPESEIVNINPYSILNLALKKCKELNYLN